MDSEPIFIPRHFNEVVIARHTTGEGVVYMFVFPDDILGNELKITNPSLDLLLKIAKQFSEWDEIPSDNFFNIKHYKRRTV